MENDKGGRHLSPSITVPAITAGIKRGKLLLQKLNIGRLKLEFGRHGRDDAVRELEKNAENGGRAGA